MVAGPGLAGKRGPGAGRNPIPKRPVDKIPPAFERRCIRAGRFASPVHTSVEERPRHSSGDPRALHHFSQGVGDVNYTSHYVMCSLRYSSPSFRSALRFG